MAVRLPKGFNLPGEEVEILQRDGEIIIRKIPCNLAEAFRLLTLMPEDFFADAREDLPPQPRDFG